MASRFLILMGILSFTFGVNAGAATEALAVQAASSFFEQHYGEALPESAILALNEIAGKADLSATTLPMLKQQLLVCGSASLTILGVGGDLFPCYDFRLRQGYFIYAGGLGLPLGALLTVVKNAFGPGLIGIGFGMIYVDHDQSNIESLGADNAVYACAGVAVVNTFGFKGLACAESERKNDSGKSDLVDEIERTKKEGILKAHSRKLYFGGAMLGFGLDINTRFLQVVKLD